MTKSLIVSGYENREHAKRVDQTDTEAVNENRINILVCGSAGDFEAAKAEYAEATSTYLIDASLDVDGVIGDLIGSIALAMPTDSVGVLKSLGKPITVTMRLGTESIELKDISRVDCYVAGDPTVRTALATAGSLAGLTVHDDNTCLPRQRGSASLAIAAWRSTLAERQDIHQRKFPTLVRTGGHDVTSLTHALLVNDGIMLGGGCESACADLLERIGYPEYADGLRALIDHWVSQRLWRVNHVPEMVLHDAAHSVAVDRNVASLCEPFVQTRSRAFHDPSHTLDASDVLILAIAAWLHDWGHASVRYGENVSVNPTDVRNYHGAFSARLLSESNNPVHRVWTLAERLKMNGLADQVGLISRHHQGWTSCDDLEATPKTPHDSVRLTVKQELGWDQTEEEGPLVRSFDHDFYHLDGGPRPPGSPDFGSQSERLKKARIRLSVLRIAAALDIGIHRIPNYCTQSSDRDGMLHDYLDQCADRLNLVPGSPVENLFKSNRNPITVLREGYARVREIKGELTEDQLSDKLQKEVTGSFRGSNYDARPNPNLNTSQQAQFQMLREQLSEIAGYVEHVLHQGLYYEEQYTVRAVLPVPTKTEFAYNLRLHVLPNGNQDSCEIADQMQALARREWGQEVRRTGHPPEPATTTKEGILFCLQDIGIRIDKAHTKKQGEIELLVDVPVEIHEWDNDQPLPGWAPGAAPFVPAEPEMGELGVAPFIAYPDGWADWTTVDSLGGQGLLATTLDRSLTLQFDGEGRVLTWPAIPGRDTELALRQWDSALRPLCICDPAPCFVAATSGTVVFYDWLDGDWGNPRVEPHAGAADIRRAFWLPGQGNASDHLILVMKDGRLMQWPPPRMNCHGLPPVVLGIDMLQLGSTMWWAWSDEAGQAVHIQAKNSMELPPWTTYLPGTPITNIWLATPGPDTVSVYAQANDGAIKRRTLRADTREWK